MAVEMTKQVGAEFFSPQSLERTGKFSRQLRSTWHDAWETPGAPAALPMPFDGVKSAARVVQDFKEDFAEAMDTVMGWSE